LVQSLSTAHPRLVPAPPLLAPPLPAKLGAPAEFGAPAKLGAPAEFGAPAKLGAPA